MKYIKESMERWKRSLKKKLIKITKTDNFLAAPKKNKKEANRKRISSRNDSALADSGLTLQTKKSRMLTIAFE